MRIDRVSTLSHAARTVVPAAAMIVMAALSGIARADSGAAPAEIRKVPKPEDRVPVVPPGIGNPGIDIRSPEERLESGPLVNASKRTGNQAESTIAINPTNPDNVVVFTNEGSASAIFRAYSLDGGLTWTGSDILPGACCDGQAAFDGFGNLFLVFIGSNKIRVVVSSDGGVTFGTPVDLNTNGGDQPSIAVGDGSVWVDWNQNGVMVARSAPVFGLGSWGAFGFQQSIPNATGSFGGIAVGPGPGGGKVIVTYQNPYGDQGPSTIYANVDPDGLGPAGFGPRVTVTTTNVGGFDYIPPQSGRSIDAEAGLVWDGTGGQYNDRIYLVYTDETVNENNDTDIMLRTSVDDGQTWSAAVRVNDDLTTRCQFLPYIALDPTTGVVAIGWHDSRNDDGVPGSGGTNGIPGDDAEYYASFSTDGGATWAANERLSGGFSNAAMAGSGVDYGDYVGTTAYGGIFRPAWADNSNSTGDNPDGTLSRFDIYTSAYPISDPLSAAGQPVRSAGRGGASVSLVLSAPSPNPASGPAALDYGLPTASRVQASLLDAAGREVLRLFDGEESAGWHRLEWSGADPGGTPLPSGVYFLRVSGSGQTQARRTIVVH
jgi:hypothetical protein